MSSKPTVSRASPRKLPREFNFHWGSGQVVEEASVRCNFGKHRGWEPTIQLLRYDEDGSEMLRFCVFQGSRLSRMWPLMDEGVIGELSKEVGKNPGIRKMLKKLL